MAQHRILILSLFALIALANLVPLAAETILPYSTDLSNHIAAIVQAKAALLSGEFPLRIAPLEHDGMGYPLFQFSSPTSYLIAGLIYIGITPSNPYSAYKLTLLIASLVGACFTYRLSNLLKNSSRVSLLTSVFYLTTPYYLVLSNHFGAFNESIALGVIPMVVYYNLQRFHNNKDITLFLLAALSWYLLSTVHLISFFYFSIFFGAFLLFLSLQKYESLTNLIGVGIAYSFGLLLSLWFLAPTALLSSFFRINSTFVDFYKNNFLTPLTSLFSLSMITPWPLKNNYLSANSSLHFALGWPMLIIASISLYLLITRKLKLDNHDKMLFRTSILLFIGIFFLLWSPIDIWQSIPKIFLVGQYSYRFISQLCWLAIFLLMFLLSYLNNRNSLQNKWVVIAILLLGLSSSPWLPRLGQNPQTLSNLSSRPLLNFSRDDYLLDLHKLMHVNIVDEISLEKKDTHNGFITERVFPAILVRNAHTPKILAEFNSTVKANTPYHLIAMINDDVISTIPLQSGPFSWIITLDKEKIFKHYPKAENLKIRFKIESDLKKVMPNTKFSIKPENITLLGLMPPQETLSVKQVSQFCNQADRQKTCILDVPTSVKLLDLPVLYYPALLDIKINGKKVPYYPAVYRNFPIVSILPQSGIKNVIQIRFRGLNWANWVSGIAWIAWLIILLHSQISTMSLIKDNGEKSNQKLV